MKIHLPRRQAAGLLITAHRPGLLPTLLECRTTPELLAEIVEELTAGAPAARRHDFPGLFCRHEGNLREALRELYDTYSVVRP